MISIFMSKFEVGYYIAKEKLKKMINANDKVVIIPWSFAEELKSKDINEFFNDRRKKKYFEPLHDLGINDKNITILDCYNDSSKYMIKKIKESKVLILTGGNPEMLCKKILDSGIINEIRNYDNIIIGSSAGAEVQLKKYFITKKNNYYNKFDWYDGLGIINNDFYFDVHSIKRGRYLPSLKEKSKKMKRNIYCLFDDGIMFYNRKSHFIECYGNYIEYGSSKD